MVRIQRLLLESPIDACSTSGRTEIDNLGPSLIGAPAALLKIWRKKRAYKSRNSKNQVSASPSSPPSSSFSNSSTESEFQIITDSSISSQLSPTYPNSSEFLFNQGTLQSNMDENYANDHLHSSCKSANNKTYSNSKTYLKMAKIPQLNCEVEGKKIKELGNFLLESSKFPSKNNFETLNSTSSNVKNNEEFSESKVLIKNLNSTTDSLCWESINGFKRQYFKILKRKKGKNYFGFEMSESDKRQTIMQNIIEFAKSYVLPEGYPECVSPSFTPYMKWRAVQYFFGGAMSVFTTRSLLCSLGLSKSKSTSAALAVNWVIKDGAGRIGKMLFARHGKKFDSDLKQFRFGGDLLMEIGAGIELCTVLAPNFFLPLACCANVAKNVAAVTATSTRAPIYKSFAKNENIGDVTAKGESVSNLCDLMGTGLGIFLSRKNPSLISTFCILSMGYLFSSFQEVKSVELPTLNRARFSVAVKTFLYTGKVPSPKEANEREKIFVLPWAIEKPLEIGVRICDAFSSVNEFQKMQIFFKDEQYLITYKPQKRKAFVVLKENAQTDDVLRATFQAHILLHVLNKKVKHVISDAPSGKFPGSKRECLRNLSSDEISEAMTEASVLTKRSFYAFKEDAIREGWIMKESLLNPGDARLCIS